MKTIGIKLADGSFYPVLKDNEPCQKQLELTTAHNNQTRIMVDLYRSETESMDDAEYVDTLQIDHINEHPRGDANISFVVAIDENKELSAHIQDEETGLESETTIELINRTLEQRMADEPGDYDISETAISEEELEEIDLTKQLDEPLVQESEPEDEGEIETESETEKVSLEKPVSVSPSAGAVAGGGLLAAAMLLNKEAAENEVSEEPSDSDNFLQEDSQIIEEQVNESVEETFEESIIDDSDFTQMEENISEEPVIETFNADELEMNDVVLDKEPVFDDEPLFEEETSETELTEDPFQGDDFDTVPNQLTDDELSADPVPSDYDLPDFDDSMSNNDFDYSSAEETESLFDLPDFDDEQPVVSQNNDLNDDLDWDFDEELTRAENSGNTDSGSGLSFTGLFDKETELGESSYSYEDDDSENKKTKTSVVICIICAIICIIAVLLILFVIPSKLNVLKKVQNEETKTELVNTPEEKTEDSATSVKTEETEKLEKLPVIVEAVEPEVPSAKEDEVIIIEEAEEVKPEPPAPPVKEEPKPDIRYKIRWGDTLWDIADTYYKNPWRYKKIARYNGIRNPDYIISGKTILIPQE